MAIPNQGPDAPPAGAGLATGDQRGSPRLALLIRAAKIIARTGEFLCVVRDASETGISVALFHPLPAGGPLVLEMANGDRYPIEPVWAAEDGTGLRAGFRFDRPVSLDRLVEAPSRYAKRAVRVNLAVPCELTSLAGSVAADLCNISQQGALVRSPVRLALAQQVRLKAHGLPEVAARVRWRRDDAFGLVFQDTFQFAQLGQIVPGMQTPIRRTA